MALEPLLFVYCVMVVMASFCGGRLPSIINMTHLRTQILMSFVGGLMLGIATLHLLPHAAELLQSSSKVGIAALIGIVSMFLLLRAFHPHHHHGPEGSDEHADCDHSHHVRKTEQASRSKSHQHDHENGHSHDDENTNSKSLGWIGMLVGMWLHTLVDGIALGASAIAEHNHATWLGLAGLGTFLAVALHKPLDAFAITSTMKASGWSTSQQNIVNIAFSLACPLGALLMYMGMMRFGESSQMLGWGLAISAGFFVCIALADLLPEVAFHDHDRGKLTLALFLGIALAFAIECLPSHSHDHHHHHGQQDLSGQVENVAKPTTSQQP